MSLLKIKINYQKSGQPGLVGGIPAHGKDGSRQFLKTPSNPSYSMALWNTAAEYYSLASQCWDTHTVNSSPTIKGITELINNCITEHHLD